MKHFSLLLTVVTLSCAGTHFLAAQTRPAEAREGIAELVTIERGTLPVVLSAPHDGTQSVPGGRVRTDGTTVRDMHTAEITRLVAEFLEERFGARPHVVIAEFSRRYADPNRGPGLREDEAYDSPAAKVHYDAFHRGLRHAVDDVRERHGSGLLVDIHGQSARPNEIIRGTRNGETVQALLKKHGIEALIGPQSLFGFLAERGHAVEPAVQNAPNSPRDERIYTGGYIVLAYGSQQANGIDAIQVEIGRDLRQPAVRRQTARDLADAIASHVEAFLKAESAPADRSAVGIR